MSGWPVSGLEFEHEAELLHSVPRSSENTHWEELFRILWNHFVIPAATDRAITKWNLHRQTLQAVHPMVVLQTPEIMAQNRWKTKPTKQDRVVLIQNTFNPDGSASNLSQTICYTNSKFSLFSSAFQMNCKGSWLPPSNYLRNHQWPGLYSTPA
jgi:hypothetical protein